MITLIQKFGGTSVGSPARMKALPAVISGEERRIVVLSAVSGTTNSLVKIAEALLLSEPKRATELIDQLEASYVVFVNELLSTEEFNKKGLELIQFHFNFIKSFVNDVFTPLEERSILAQGELLSTGLFHLYLTEQGVSSVLLPALEYMRIDDDHEPDLDYITSHLAALVEQNPNVNLFITQGYICRNAFGQIDNLKRGGSDYTASLVGAALRVREVQIWTDIDGMHNNDPRIVDKTYRIDELSFDEAAELAYFGAKILHPSSVLPAQKFNIPVRLLNTMDPAAPGTLISSEAKGAPIKAVAAKDGIIAIKIRSSRMLMAYGFLRSVFEVFERFKTPIDMITTSEVAVTLTIDQAENLQEIIFELESFGLVEVDTNQSIVCVVGDFLMESEGMIVKVLNCLNDIPVRMISYGGSKNNVSILISSEHKVKALRALNDKLFYANNLQTA